MGIQAAELQDPLHLRPAPGEGQPASVLLRTSIGSSNSDWIPVESMSFKLAEVDHDPAGGSLLRSGERLGNPAGSVDVELAAKRDAALSRVVLDLGIANGLATVHHLLFPHIARRTSRMTPTRSA